MTTINWLHLSDFHIRAAPSYPYEASIVLKALLNHVARSRLFRLHPLDFLFVTGDLACCGKKEDFELVGAFFNELLKVTHVKKAHTFIVPGNHDIDRGEISKIVRAAEKGLNDPRAVVEFFSGKPEERRLILRRLDNYAKFMNKYFDGKLCFCDRHLYYAKKFTIDNKRIAILGLNSAWICYGGKRDNNRILVGEVQVIDALKHVADSDFKIALMHHPFSLLKKFDVKDVRTYIKAECDFILLGHRHHQKAVFEQDKSGRNLFVASGASYLNRKYPNGYNFVRFDISSGKGEINFFRYDPELRKFKFAKRRKFDLSKEIFLDKMKFDKLRLEL